MTIDRAAALDTALGAHALRARLVAVEPLAAANPGAIRLVRAPIAGSVRGVAAARMRGAGFGGCTINLVERDAVETLRAAIMEQYPARTGLTPRVFVVDAVAGAGVLDG